MTQKLQFNSESIEKALIRSEKFVKTTCQVKGFDSENSGDFDEEKLENLLGKRVREMVDYCLDVDVGLEKK